MGLFSIFKKIGKAVGKVAGVAGGLALSGNPLFGAGLSVLKSLKQRGEAKRAAKMEAQTNQLIATANKLSPTGGQIRPVGRSTTAYTSGRGLSDAQWSLENKFLRVAEQDRELNPVRERATTLLSLEDIAARQPRKKRAKRLMKARGGLNLKAMSQAWVAAGKPESWQDWIRDFPIFFEKTVVG